MAMKKGELARTVETDTRDVGAHPAKAREPKRVRGFRMSDPEWSRLVGLLDKRGLSIASGIRMIVTEWMARAEHDR